MNKISLSNSYWQKTTAFFALILFTSVFAYAQSISGTINSDKGEKLPGVSVVIKGTTKGTTTDKEGNYTIEVRKSQTLIFSFVGYELQETVINDQKTINVSLKEALESLEEVVVTAENRSVSAQKVPITLDLITGKNIQKNGVTDLMQLQAIAPSLNIVTNTIFNQINVRGVGSNDGAAELSDQAVTVGIDGEYLNRPVALNAAMFDLDRVEILKGPQGTLYGRNATAGAVNIIVKKPTQAREVEIGASYGNYNSLKLNGAVNLPLGKIAAIRVAGLLSKHDGYRLSSGAGAFDGRFDNGNFWAARAGLDINPTKNLNIYIAGETSKTNQQAPAQYGVDMNAFPELKGSSPFTWTTTLPKDFPVATAGFVKVDQSAIRGKLAYDFGKALLTYTGGFRKVDMKGYQPLNGWVPETASFDNNLNYRTQSHELRLNGESTKLSWQLGGFYGDEDQDVARGFVNVGLKGLFNGQSPYFNFFIRTINSKTAAVFGQATYKINEKLGLTVGLRNTTDDKSRVASNLAAGPLPATATVTRFFYPNRPTSMTQEGMKPATNIPNEGSWNSTTWLVGLDYNIDASKMLFAKVSKGYKAGGFDNIGEYNPETIIAYEIGTKNKFVNNRLKMNASAFLYDYSDQQISVFISTAVGAAIQNAGKSSIKGFELETEFAATKADRFRFNLNLLDAKFLDLPTLRNRVGTSVEVVNLKGNNPIQSPKVTLVGGYNHDFKLSKGTITAGIQTLFKSSYFLTPFNFAMDKQKAYTKTDVNLTYSSGNGKFDLGVFAQNLEDNRIITYAGFNGNPAIYNWVFGSPRLMGVQVNFHL